jgi:hypothetical protein
LSNVGFAIDTGTFKPRDSENGSQVVATKLFLATPVSCPWPS